MIFSSIFKTYMMLHESEDSFKDVNAGGSVLMKGTLFFVVHLSVKTSAKVVVKVSMFYLTFDHKLPGVPHPWRNCNVISQHLSLK